MKKKYVFPFLLFSLTSCNFSFAKSILSNLGVVSEESALSAISNNDSTSQNITTNTTSQNITSSSSQTTSTAANTTTTSQDQSTWSLTDHGNDKLPIGNVYAPAPNNIYTPTVLVYDYETSSWVNRETKDSFPNNNWSYIYGNNITNPSFYAESSGGGLKMDQKYKGFQSEAFNCASGKRIELRINISQVNNASGEGSIDPWGYIYFYDKYTNLLTDKTIELSSGDIRVSNAGNYKRWYVNDAENISYFEFRLAALCHYGKQNYNIGIDKVSIKLWPTNSN